MSDHPWQSVSHLILKHSQITVAVDVTTGILRETHTGYRNEQSYGETTHFYYHREGRFPHETYEAALAEAQENGWGGGCVAPPESP
jgi:hypothetical protein